MRLYTLIENTSIREELAAEHGLSLLIERSNRRILFDAGKTGAFADNAGKMGMDLKTVDFAVLSHGHDDHGGGLGRFLEINAGAPVYVNQNAFGIHRNARGKSIALDKSLLDSGRLILTGDSFEIAPGLTLYTCNDRPRPFPADSFGLTREVAGVAQPDDFCHEQYLLIEENGTRYLFSGCSHKGLLNLLHWFRPDVLVGGFHFRDLDPEGPGRETLDAAVRIIRAMGTVCYTGHCTGKAQFDYLKARLGDQLQALSGGAVFEL